MWWVAIILEGMIVMTMATGPEAHNCEILGEMIVADIQAGVMEDEDGTKWVMGHEGERLSWGEWRVTCTQEQPTVGEEFNE